MIHQYFLPTGKSNRDQKRKISRIRHLDWLRLEDRIQMAAFFIPPQSDGDLIQAPVITSINGVLSTSMDMVRAGIPGSGESILYGNKPLYSNTQPPPPPFPGRVQENPLNFAAAYQFTLSDGTVLPAQFPGVTLKLKQGETLKLNISNSLGDPNSAPMPPDAALTTNFHTHGLFVSPLGSGDNIYRAMNADGSYQTVVTVPDYQPSGVDWYHVHYHGYSADQVYAGLAGVMQIGDPLDPWPQYLNKYDEKILSITLANKQEQADGSLMMANPRNTYGFSAYKGGASVNQFQVYVNGQFNPKMTMKPGETQIWTLIAPVRNGSFNFGITDENGLNGWQTTVLHFDGTVQDSVPRAYQAKLPTDYIKNGMLALDPGARITVAVTAPTTPGTYYLIDNLAQNQLTQQSLSKLPFSVMSIEVAGAQATEPVPVFTPTGTIPEVYTATPDQQRNFEFSFDQTGPDGSRAFKINGYTFPNGPIVSIQAGEVEEWTLTNTSPVDHPFHVHQNRFAVISINGENVSPEGNGTYPYVSMRDTVNIPAGGKVVIRFRVSPIAGKYVFHCHILPHEDYGMMMSVIAGPNADELRQALGAGVGQGGGVLVQSGNGQLIGRVNPLPPSWKGGVATATGNLNGGLTQEIVAGPASRGTRSIVTIYDGSDLSIIKRFNPFPEYPASGVSLAIGDVNHDGIGEIIIGRVGSGRSLVRIFHPDGTLFLQLKGTLPGHLPNGVSVASADFNGDNYDDVAIGAGKGYVPRVVGLDGFSLGLPEGAMEMKLFDFIAPGEDRSGVNLAGGYSDPSTVPSYLANLITTPASGKETGKIYVWNVGAAPHDMSAMSDMPMEPVLTSSESSEPELMATLTPFGKRRISLGLKITTTRLGKNGVAAVGAWWSAHNPVYQSINLDGSVTNIPTSTKSMAAQNRVKANRRDNS